MKLRRPRRQLRLLRAGLFFQGDQQILPEREDEVLTERRHLGQALHQVAALHPGHQPGQRLGVWTMVDIRKRPREGRVHDERQQPHARPSGRPQVLHFGIGQVPSGRATAVPVGEQQHENIAAFHFGPAYLLGRRPLRIEFLHEHRLMTKAMTYLHRRLTVRR